MPESIVKTYAPRGRRNLCPIPGAAGQWAACPSSSVRPAPRPAHPGELDINPSSLDAPQLEGRRDEGFHQPPRGRRLPDGGASRCRWASHDVDPDGQGRIVVRAVAVAAADLARIRHYDLADRAC